MIQNRFHKISNILQSKIKNSAKAVKNAQLDAIKIFNSIADDFELLDKINHTLRMYDDMRPFLVENMREQFKNLNTNENLALHLYELFSTLDGVETDE